MEHIRDTKIPLADQMKFLEVGDVLMCPPEEILKASSYASKYGFMWQRKFKTRKDTERGVFLVTREE